ncbi:hypothetical protein [Acidipila sp. EB88]|uniref:hypothetical protein n=1 Tax=Acidipila sp. EB88 TaxID=2305226 RepID=UPI0013153937|nr:hypothetical protein [Acidipila sp. EB88]
MKTITDRKLTGTRLPLLSWLREEVLLVTGEKLRPTVGPHRGGTNAHARTHLSRMFAD